MDLTETNYIMLAYKVNFLRITITLKIPTWSNILLFHINILNLCFSVLWSNHTKMANIKVSFNAMPTPIIFSEVHSADFLWTLNLYVYTQ